MAGQRVELPAYSMFSATPVYEVGGDVVFGLLKDAIVPDASDDLYTVPPGGAHRLDAISYYFYNTPHLWWVLARVNNVVDPLIGVAVGTVIRIPTKSRLASEGVLGV